MDAWLANNHVDGPTPLDLLKWKSSSKVLGQSLKPKFLPKMRPSERSKEKKCRQACLRPGTNPSLMSGDREYPGVEASHWPLPRDTPQMGDSWIWMKLQNWQRWC